MRFKLSESWQIFFLVGIFLLMWISSKHVSVHNLISRFDYFINFSCDFLLKIILRFMLLVHHVKEVRCFNSRTKLSRLRARGSVFAELTILEVTLIELTSSLLSANLRFIFYFIRSRSMRGGRSTNNTLFIRVMTRWEAGSTLLSKRWFIILLEAIFHRSWCHVRNSVVKLGEWDCW